MAELFPGATAVSRLRVYQWPAADGLHGGSPHLHTASAEGYIVLGGEGTLQTLSSAGYQEHALGPGTVLWFTPGTVHRLVTAGPGPRSRGERSERQSLSPGAPASGPRSAGSEATGATREDAGRQAPGPRERSERQNLSPGADLDILVVMQNAGLPEAGDAVLTFPPEILADPAAYAHAVTLPPGSADALACADLSDDTGSISDGGPVGDAARARRDLAVAGYLELRSRVLKEGPGALEPLYAAAATLVRERAERWRELWHDGALTQARRTGEQLADLATGHAGHLRAAAVHHGQQPPGPRAFGMCGRLQTWHLSAES